MRVFLSLRGLAVHRSCLWLASQALAQVSGTHQFARRSKAGSPLDRLSQGKGSVPLCRNDGEPSPYAEATPQSKTPPSGLLGGDPARAVGRAGGGRGGAPPLGAQEVPPEWVSNCVYLLLAVLQEYIYSISCLSLLLTRDLFRVLPRTARCW